MGFATEVSISPARFLACISRLNATFPVANSADRLAVHAVTETQRDLAELFLRRDRRRCRQVQSLRVDGRGRRHADPDGVSDLVPGRIVERIDLGDHVGFVLHPESWHDGGAITQLTVRELDEIVPGHPE